MASTETTKDFPPFNLNHQTVVAAAKQDSNVSDLNQASQKLSSVVILSPSSSSKNNTNKTDPFSSSYSSSSSSSSSLSESTNNNSNMAVGGVKSNFRNHSSSSATAPSSSSVVVPAGDLPETFNTSNTTTSHHYQRPAAAPSHKPSSFSTTTTTTTTDHQKQQQSSSGGGGKRQRRRRGPSNNKRRGGRPYKPYHKLTFTEKKEREAREQSRAEQRRAAHFERGRAMAPYNTTQFILEDQEQRQREQYEDEVATNCLIGGSKESVSTNNNNIKPVAGQQEQNDPHSESNAAAGFHNCLSGSGNIPSDPDRNSTSDSGYDVDSTDFDAEYEKFHIERLEGLSKTELIRELLELDSDHQRTSKEVGQLRLSMSSLRSENYQLRRALYDSYNVVQHHFHQQQQQQQQHQQNQSPQVGDVGSHNDHAGEDLREPEHQLFQNNNNVADHQNQQQSEDNVISSTTQMDTDFS